MNAVFIRAEIMGELPSGQKLVHILANNADGIAFYTDDKSIITDLPTVNRKHHKDKHCFLNHTVLHIIVHLLFHLVLHGVLEHIVH